MMSTDTTITDETLRAAFSVAAAVEGTSEPSVRAVSAIAKAIHDAVMAERARIIARLLEEAELTPCGEDAMVTRSNAFLIKADFSYEEAERLSDKEEA